MKKMKSLLLMALGVAPCEQDFSTDQRPSFL